MLIIIAAANATIMPKYVNQDCDKNISPNQPKFEYQENALCICKPASAILSMLIVPMNKQETPTPNVVKVKPVTFWLQ